MTAAQFDKITDTTYATSDWSVVIDRTAAGDWLVAERGTPKHSEPTAEAAIEWATKWLAGQTIVVH